MTFNDFYISIPEEILDLSLDVNNKILPMYIFIYSNENKKGYSDLTMNDIISFCKLKPKGGKGKTNEQFKKALLEMTDNKIILNIDNSISNCCNKSLIKTKILEFESKNILKVKFSTINNIMKVSNINNILLVNVYLYLIKNLNNDEITKSSICAKCNITETTVYKYIDLLIEMDLIKTNMFKSEKPYVYIHINKLNNEVLYVGKGRRDRYKDLNARNSTYVNFINNIGKDNIECRIIEYFNDDESAFINEFEIANKYKSMGQAKYCIELGNTYIQDGQINNI